MASSRDPRRPLGGLFVWLLVGAPVAVFLCEAAGLVVIEEREDDDEDAPGP